MTLQHPQVLAIMAGGRATRLFGPEGGSKAAVTIGGKPLIGYILEEALHLGIEHLIITARPTEHKLHDLVRSYAFKTIHVITDVVGDGTLQPVSRLLRETQGTPALLSTCDVFGKEGSIIQFVHESLKLSRENTEISFAASTHISDDNPIWIRTGTDHNILDYGKDIAPTTSMFASIRLCSGDVYKLLDTPLQRSVQTDTKLMRAFVRSYPKRTIAVLQNDLFDIDTTRDLELARAMCHPGS